MSAFCLITIISSIKAQNFHEVGFGFSGMRIWEVDPPEFIVQDLDYYWNPRITYQVHFFDEKIAFGAAIGLVQEVSSNEGPSYYGYLVREDNRKSVILDLNASLNLFRTPERFFQLSAGLRTTRTYYFKHYSEITDGGSFNYGGYEVDSWYDPNYSLTFSMAYQHVLFKKLNAKQSVNFRVAFDVIYSFPTYRVSLGFEDNFVSIVAGPSVSLIWRIRGKKNRGLF